MGIYLFPDSTLDRNLYWNECEYVVFDNSKTFAWFDGLFDLKSIFYEDQFWAKMILRSWKFRYQKLILVGGDIDVVYYMYATCILVDCRWVLLNIMMAFHLSTSMIL